MVSLKIHLPLDPKKDKLSIAGKFIICQTYKPCGKDLSIHTLLKSAQVRQDFTGTLIVSHAAKCQ